MVPFPDVTRFGRVTAPISLECSEMLDIEIVAHAHDITQIQGRLAQLTDHPVQRFDHKGVGGESGLAGLLVAIVPGVLKAVVEFIGLLAPSGRGVTIKVEGLELQVRNMKDASAAISLLADRGLLPK
jgi:hypothetical protein